MVTKNVSLTKYYRYKYRKKIMSSQNFQIEKVIFCLCRNFFFHYFRSERYLSSLSEPSFPYQVISNTNNDLSFFYNETYLGSGQQIKKRLIEFIPRQKYKNQKNLT